LLIINTESALAFILPDEIGTIIENDHIAIIDPVKIRGVCNDFEYTRDAGMIYPS
jgi:hypothetical protein